jgi:Lysine methyltransferase
MADPSLSVSVRCSPIAVGATFVSSTAHMLTLAHTGPEYGRHHAILLPLQGIGHQLWPATFLLTSVLEERQATDPGYWQVGPDALQAKLPHADDLHRSCTYEDTPVFYWDERLTQLQGKRVLELGSGCGLVGLFSSALGAHTLLTDLPSVLVQ